MKIYQHWFFTRICK